ncbi:TPR-like protein [Hypomontagnella monticulosa]|nr:TPR-like protein [Hypomontagnella monticulosa]
MTHPSSSALDALQAHFARNSEEPTTPTMPHSSRSSTASPIQGLSAIAGQNTTYMGQAAGPSMEQGHGRRPLPTIAPRRIAMQPSNRVLLPKPNHPSPQPYAPSDFNHVTRNEPVAIYRPYPPPSTASTQGPGFPPSLIPTNFPVPQLSVGVPHAGWTPSQLQVPTGGQENSPMNVASHVAATEDEVDPMDTATDALLERQNDLNKENPLPKLAPTRGFLKKYFQDEKKPQRSRGGGSRKRGPRKAAEPTGDIKYRLNMASQALINGRIDEALEFVQEAIRINGETYRAWILLASLRQEKGDREGHFYARYTAATLQPKIIDEWLKCAELAVELRDEIPEKTDEFFSFALHCYSNAVKIDPTHTAARHGRAALRFEIGHLRSAVKDYGFLVEHYPFDIYAQRSYAEACVLLADSGKPQYADGPENAVEAYSRCIAHFREKGFDPRYPFDWQDVKIFVEILAYVDRFEDALRELRSLSRWLLTRSDETFWDDLSDDREWDIDNTRRLEVEAYQDGKYPASSYGRGLPLELRTKLAIYRLKLGQEDEAMVHFKFIDPDDPNASELLSEHPHLVAEAASALYEAGLLPMALRFYEPLREPDLLDAECLVRAGRCYLDAGDKRQAEECFMAAIDQDESNSEARVDARYELAKMYEAARAEREAYILVNEAIRLQEASEQAREQARKDEENQGDDNDEDREGDEDLALLATALESSTRNDTGAKQKQVKRPPKPKVDKPKQKPKPKEPKERKPKTQSDPATRRRKLFARTEELQLEEKIRADALAEAWNVVRNSRASTDDDAMGPSVEFMSAARNLVDDFRSYRDFYTWDKYLAHLGIHQAREKLEARKGNPNLLAMADRLSNNLNPDDAGAEKQTKQAPVSYRGVTFDEWLDLFLEYALGLAQMGRFQDAYKVCESARDATIFKSKEDMFLIHVAWAACALRGRDEEMCVASARWLMREYQYDTDPFRFFSALSRLCPSPASWYASGPVQKYMLRQIKLMDRAITSGAAVDSGDEEEAPTGRVYQGKELDITLLMLYGHILFISNSFTYALNYFMRAYTLDPTNSMVILSVGHCYVHYALKRQAENRQYLLTQGFLFLHQYYEIKIASPDAAQRQEAHYNLARSYHAIGIPHLAAEYYRRALQDVPDDSGKGIMGRDDLTQEAAYNLQQIYWAGGDMNGVKAIADKYLIL